VEMTEARRDRKETILELNHDTAPLLAATFGEWLCGVHFSLSNFLEKLELLQYQDEPVPETDTGRWVENT
jgi:hypothetical protein